MSSNRISSATAERARAMRADGATYSEIREALGIGSSTTVSRILGIAGTGSRRGPRSRISSETRERARALRRDGLSVPEISRTMDIARSSAWKLTKDIAWTPGPNSGESGRRYWEERRKLRAAERAHVRDAARSEVGMLSERAPIDRCGYVLGGGLEGQALAGA